MGEDLDAGTKLEIYRLVLQRYKELIAEKESLSISEIRQKVSPYNDFIRKLNAELTRNIVSYSYKDDFIRAAQNAMDYVRDIKTCEFAFTFFMDFQDMHKLKIGTVTDKAILFAALLRSLGSENVRVLVTKKDKPYVKFSFEKEYVFVPETGSLLLGEDSMKLFSDDPVSYSFSDLIYENNEED
jgi:hypothetical protein